MRKSKPKDIFCRVVSDLKIGIRHNRVYINDEGWKPILLSDFLIRIRELYPKEIRAEISAGAVNEAVERLLQEPSLQLHFTEETEEKYVNLKSGVFDVERGKMLDNAEGFDFGYTLNFRYICRGRKSECFERFCKTTFPEQTKEKRKLLLQMLGYVISDYAKAKTGFFLIGESNSGKSVILELLQRIHPEQAVTSVPLYRLENRFNLARLADARVNVNMEISEKSFKAVDIYKMLTSNEVVTAEHKGKKPFEFRLKCKSINAGNVLPEISNLEGMEAVLNRMTILLFPVGIKKADQDPQLLEKLWADRDIIFSNALDELHELQKTNFIFEEPEDTKKLKKQMMSEGHAFEEFVDEYCVRAESAQEHFSVLYDAFKEFCEDNLYGVNLSKTQFSQRLARTHGLVRKKFRINGGKPLYGVVGLRLKSYTEYEEDSLGKETAENKQIYRYTKKERNSGTSEQKK